MKAKFIVFEGLDGSGKSSLMKKLSDHLTHLKRSHLLTREPGGTELGEQIRPLLLQNENPKLSPGPRAELLLYIADRAQHVEKIIRPALEAEIWVLSDRFAPSSVAFQAGGRKIAEEDVHWLNQFATKGLQPDLIVLLDLTTEEAQSRRRNRQQQLGLFEDRMESEAEQFHQRVRTSFLAQARTDSDRWLVLDASKSVEQLFAQLLQLLQEKSWLDL